ncbi:MAG: hypothetical protein LBI92_04660 [Azoarcus sp.]|jgi:hypothetical protein|nr:hypothetical protein [Azoarcus sp.]
MKTLFLAWQAPDIRSWFPVGRLDADAALDHERFVFQYTQGARSAQQRGFRPLLSFPDFKGRYQAESLFPMFGNRVLNSRRKGFDDYLRTLALDHNDPLDILAITGGERQTDNFEVFPKIEKQADNSFRCRFFLHGLRHMSDSAKERSKTLHEGDELGVSVELTNPKTGVAIQLTSDDYAFIGWTPRYLVGDLLKSIASVQEIRATVVKVNDGSDVPMNRRVLVEFYGRLPDGFQPMTGEEFQPIVSAH